MASKSTKNNAIKGTPIYVDAYVNINEAADEAPEPCEPNNLTWISLTWADLLNDDFLPKEYSDLNTNSLVKSTNEAKHNALHILTQEFGDPVILTLAIDTNGETILLRNPSSICNEDKGTMDHVFLNIIKMTSNIFTIKLSK